MCGRGVTGAGPRGRTGGRGGHRRETRADAGGCPPAGEVSLRSIIVCGGVFSRVMFAINCMSLRCQGCADPVPLEAKRDTDGKPMGFGRGKSATSVASAGKQLTG